MGVASDEVRAEERYFSPFLCTICKNLVSLDAIVTTRCSHPFCRACFAHAASERGANPDCCPTCDSDITSRNGKVDGSMVFADTELGVQPLADAQPLAFQVLRRMLVGCPKGSECGCEWSGEYEALSAHLRSRVEMKKGSGLESRRAGLTRRGSLRLSRRRLLRSEKSLPSVSEIEPVTCAEHTATSLHRNSFSSAAGNVTIDKESPRWSLAGSERGVSFDSIPIDPQHDVFQTPTCDLSSNELKGGGELDKATPKLQLGVSAMSLKSQANQRFKEGEYEAAQMLYTKAIVVMQENSSPSKEQNDLHSSLYCNRAVTFHKQKKYVDTIADCEQAITLNPQNVKAYLREWKALMVTGNVERACSLLELAASSTRDRNGPVIDELRRTRELKRQLSLVDEYMAKNEVDSARATVESLLKLSDSPCVVLAAARVDILLGKAQAALGRCTEVLDTMSSHPEALYLQAYSTFLMGKMEKAMDLLKEANQNDPDNVEIVALGRQCRKPHKAYAEGQLLVFEGEHEKAVECFTSALEGGLRVTKNSPLHGILLVERGEALLLSGQHRDALLDAQQAIEAKEDFVRAWIVKIESYHGMGRPRDALHELSKIRRGWASENPTIAEAYKKAEFEVRVHEAEMELKSMVLIPSHDKGKTQWDSRDESLPARAQSDHGILKRRPSGSRRRRSGAAGEGLDRSSLHSVTSTGTRRVADGTSNRERRRFSVM